ncbi:GNAT family N-acetyltransferase [Patescibacteria group bacterium]|nr:GNAT family N-acetyltransferase [Patescibacteria group bacterium]MBU1124028.1 GNAT family N-acetyltransferase [Patescibacteria group bacterium]MBU1911279.1 GNAT family N-acetyltransferase [Patescibacteria group bacterium]
MIEYITITKPEDINVLRGKTATYLSLHIQYDDETLDYLKDHLQDEDSLYLIAKEDNTFVGFCSIDSDWWENGYFFLREIFVEPNLHQRGIGKELMQRCIAHAQSCGANGVVTETAFENVPMQKLCKKFGFEEWENPEWDEGITYKLLF